MKLHPKIGLAVENSRRRAALLREAQTELLGLPKRSFLNAVSSVGIGGFSIIAEIKPSSPSEGDLRPVMDVGFLAKEMKEGGASAISVLTEPSVFKGSSENISSAKEACSLPVLAKDFFVHPLQLGHAAAMGADAVLLISELLGSGLEAFISTAREEGIDCLVECFSQEGIENAANCGARIIGINNRSLEDLSVDLRRTEALAPLVPNGSVVVCESGITCRNDIERLLPFGVRSFLVGTSLMKSVNAREKLWELLLPHSQGALGV